MRRRIAASLDMGHRPTVTSSGMVRLGGDAGPVLASADQVERKTGAELRRQLSRAPAGSIDTARFSMDRWLRTGGPEVVPATTQRRGAIYATDVNGREHLLRRWSAATGAWKVTKTGRGFYKNSKKTRFIVHVPAMVKIRTRDGNYYFARGLAANYTVPLTEDMIAEGLRPEVQELVRFNTLRSGEGTPEQQRAYLGRAIEEYIQANAATDGDGHKILGMFYEDRGPVVWDDSRHFTYDVETADFQDGAAPTLDVLLDRVVFGAPVTAEDMWMKHRLNEHSRRSNGQCGLDVMVAGATLRRPVHVSGKNKAHSRQEVLTADEAALKLCELARSKYPDSEFGRVVEEAGARAVAERDALTVNDNTTELRRLDEALTDRNAARRALAPYLEGVKHFLATPRTFAEIAQANDKGNVFRGKVALPSDAFSFAKVLRRTLKSPPSTRYKQFVLLFPEEFAILEDGETVRLRQNAPPRTIASEEARELIRKHGTPIRLLRDFYEEVGANLILLNGNRCVQRWDHPTPLKDDNGPLTVILNFWDHHVFSYESTANKAASTLQVKPLDDWEPKSLVSRREGKDAHLYDDMEDFAWDAFDEALSEKKSVVFRTADNLRKLLERGLEERELSWTPYYSTPSECRMVSVPFGGKRHQRVRVRKLPEEHELLRAFCDTVQEELGLKLFYKGESAAALGNAFVQQVMVGRRKALSTEDERTLRERQSNRCTICGELLHAWEIDHIVPLCKGGLDRLDNQRLIHPVCHSMVTSQLRDGGGGAHTRVLESQFSPEMARLFEEVPKCKQQYSGGGGAGCHTGEDCYALDINRCRRNGLTGWDDRPLPIGCPLDKLEPLFDEVGNMTHPWEEWHWIWVEVRQDVVADRLGEHGLSPEESGYVAEPHPAHVLYDGPHLYPWFVVESFMQAGFVTREDLPCGWRPLHTRPRKDLRDAFAAVDKAWRKCHEENWGLFYDLAEEVEDPADAMAKRMINATIGLWNVQERHGYVVRRTGCDADMRGPVTTTTFLEDGSQLKKVRQDFVDNLTMLPISLECLYRERWLMALARDRLSIWEDHAFRPTMVQRLRDPSLPQDALVDRATYVDPIDPRGVKPSLELDVDEVNVAILGEKVDCVYFSVKCDGAEDIHLATVKRLTVDAPECRFPVTKQPYWKIEEKKTFGIPDCEQKHAPFTPCFKPLPEERCRWQHLRESDMDGIDAWLHARDLWEPGEDDVLMKIAKVVVHNGGGMLTGPAGVGKTHLIRRYIRPLIRKLAAAVEGEEGAKKPRIIGAGYTHAASRIAGARTIASLLHWDKRLHDAWIIGTEVGTYPLDTLGAMSRWQMVGAKFIFEGDYDGQFLPFVDRWENTKGADVQNSRLMSLLCNGVHVHLEEYRRGVDRNLFDFYFHLYSRSDDDVKELVQRARERYPRNGTFPDMCLVMGHKKRARVNRVMNERLALEKERAGDRVLHFDWDEGELRGTMFQPQPMALWEGQELLGCPQGSGRRNSKIVQGVTYEVEEILNESIVVRMTEEFRRKPQGGEVAEEEEEDDATEDAAAEESDAEGAACPEDSDASSKKEEEADDVASAPEFVEVDHQNVALLLRLTHALCYYSVQGRTLGGKQLALLDTASSHFSRRALIVGLSRATSGGDIQVFSRAQEDSFEGIVRVSNA